jgi:esterase/lipase superfamily enzyme
MNREYHKWHSRDLNRDMELLRFGHGGTPILVFPTSMGKFFEYEDRGMIGALAHKIDRGEAQVFCPDGVDSESWYNKRVHPRWRVARHMQYEGYILHDVLPLIGQKDQSGKLAVTGCSFGGYHALNFCLRHPDIATHCVCMGGAYDIKQFTNGYYDNDIYFNNPPDFLPQMGDDWFLSRYRNRVKWVLATGEWDQCMDQNVKMAAIMHGKGIPHWLDIWGDHTGHDWPWWRAMAQKYF